MTAEIKPIKTAAEIGLAEAFAALRPRLAGTAVAARREAAFRRFEAVGLPHRRVEDWKYTDLRALMRDAKPLAAGRRDARRRRRGPAPPAACWRGSMSAASCSSTACWCPNCPISRPSRA